MIKSSLPDMLGDGPLACVFSLTYQAYSIHLQSEDAPPVVLYLGQHTQEVLRSCLMVYTWHLLAVCVFRANVISMIEHLGSAQLLLKVKGYT